MISKLQVLRVPKAQLAFLLLLIFLSALVASTQAKYGIGFALAVAFTATFDTLLTYVRKKVWFVPYAALVTGAIIGLIANPNLPLVHIALIAGVAVASKQFLRTNNGHVLNPAAAGLIFGGILLQQPVSWWAVSFQNIFQGKPFIIISFLVLLAPLTISALRLGRYLTIISFLLAHTLVSQFASVQTWSLQQLLTTLLDPTLLFFAIVMLAEPRTSPVEKKRQVFYGVCVAITTSVIGRPFLTNLLLSWKVLPDQLLISLLIGNALFFSHR